MIEQNGADDLPFGPAFSARVFQQVDSSIRRRRVLGSAAAVAMTAMVSAVVLTGLWSAPQVTPPQSHAQPALIASDDSNVASGPKTDPLTLMFPEAEPVARFAAQYTAADAPVEERDAFAFVTGTEENNENQDL